MKLTSAQIEAIREAARTVEYGSVTIHVSATAKHIDLEIRRKVRIESEAQEGKFLGTVNGVNSRGYP
jgi:hypothetical protein